MMTSLALLIVIVIDQFRTDELLRVHQQLNPAGLGRLVDQGIFYDDAHHTHFFNMTCPGHTAISTGAAPGVNGIMLNADWNWETHKREYCVYDSDHHWIDADADANDLEYGTSAKRIMTSTLGDEAKYLWKQDSKVISVSVKDRAAIALGGHAADGAFWFAPNSHKWTSSDAYFPSKKLPEWLEKYNRENPLQKPGHVDEYEMSLQAVKNTVDVALAAAKGEKLGNHKHPDILWVSFSTHDYVGHLKGDDSAELKAVLKAEDDGIARLVTELSKLTGKRKVLVALTADHGAGIDTADAAKIGIPGGKLNLTKTREELNKCLHSKGVAGSAKDPVESVYGPAVYLSDKIKNPVVARAQLKECVNDSKNGVWQGYSREDILSGQYPQTPWTKSLATSYYPKRGPDVVEVLLPYWNASDERIVNHETPYDYDTWVPLALWWPGVKKKQVHHRVAVTSLAPTLARILETRRPSGATSEYLTEVLDSLP